MAFVMPLHAATQQPLSLRSTGLRPLRFIDPRGAASGKKLNVSEMCGGGERAGEGADDCRCTLAHKKSTKTPCTEHERMSLAWKKKEAAAKARERLCKAIAGRERTNTKATVRNEVLPHK